MASTPSAKARTELNVAIGYVDRAARRLASEPGYPRQAHTLERLSGELAKLIAADATRRRADGRMRRALPRPRPRQPWWRLAALHSPGQVWTDPDQVSRFVCATHRRPLVALHPAGLADRIRWGRPGLPTGPVQATRGGEAS
jgi:hypothetical protein